MFALFALLVLFALFARGLVRARPCLREGWLAVLYSMEIEMGLLRADASEPQGRGSGAAFSPALADARRAVRDGLLRRDRLLNAARQGEPDDIRTVADEGANLEVRDPDGRTALLLAVVRGHDACVELLIERNADVDAAADDGDTALHEAARYDRADLYCGGIYFDLSRSPIFKTA
eukprot:COSAG06_NODE_22217_length_730_cov_1.377179_1_plen_175_part_01